MSEVETVPVLQPHNTELTVDELTDRLKKFDDLKTAVLKNHTMQIQGKPYILKSGWRMAATMFGISDKIESQERIDREDGSFVVTYHVVATDSRGRSTVGVGSCDSREKNADEHNTASMAHTRAKNRAISDCIGTGIVSAEEIHDPPKQSQPAQQTQQKPFVPTEQKQRHMASFYPGKCKQCNTSWEQGQQIYSTSNGWCSMQTCPGGQHAS